jgi:argininosuccinate synthase
MHISYEAGELEDPSFPGKDAAYPGLVLKKKTVDIMDTPDEPLDLRIHFEQGVPISVDTPDGIRVSGTDSPAKLFAYLNHVAGAHGVGRIDLVENRFVGLKSRGCYETPAGTVLHTALMDLETLTMDREVMRLRDGLGLKYSELVYNGFWYSPEMEFLRHSMDFAQRATTGHVDVRLHKGTVMARGRASPYSLYSENLVSTDVHGGFDPTHSTGFISTLATRLKASRTRDLEAGFSTPVE